MDLILTETADVPEFPDAVKIACLRGNLLATDYQILKWAEGELTDEEIAPIKARRQAWRDEINALETAIAASETME